MLHIQLFGALRLAVGDRPLPRPIRRQTERLLTCLLIYREIEQGREHLAYVLWPDSPEAEARAELRRHLHLLLKYLPSSTTDGGWILRDYKSVQWNPKVPLDLDVQTFETSVRRAKLLIGEDRTAQAMAELTQAVAVYQADLLPEWEDDWVKQARQRLAALYVDALDRLSRLQEEGGELPSAIATLERLVSVQPLRDEPQGRLMQLYAQLGERGKALAQFEAYASTLRATLDIDPAPGLEAQFIAIRDGTIVRTTPAMVADARQQGSPVAARNLPVPLSRFVGRAREMGEIRALARHHRLIVLIGVGGSGKTRLALEAAHELAGSFIDGTWWIELENLSDPSLIAPHIGSALGIRQEGNRSLTDIMAEYLRQRHAFLVIDNCEHLSFGVAEVVSGLLTRCPKVHVLATSRERLHIDGEVVVQVAAMSLPDQSDWVSIADLASADAVTLFVDRVHGLWPGFTPTWAQLKVIAGICRRVEGIPLAIELAAARASVLSLEEIETRLDRSSKLLRGVSRSRPDRHQSIEATIDWSFRLLSPFERTLLVRLAVFAGSFNLDAIEAVCTPQDGFPDPLADAEVLDMVASLVGKSLIAVGTHGAKGRRYRLIDMIRQYCTDRLRESGMLEPLRERHTQYFLQMAVNAEQPLMSQDRLPWLAQLEQENDNLRAAMTNLQEQHAVDPALKLACALWRFWYLHGHLSWERRWLESMLSEPHDRLDTLTLGSAYNAAGALAYAQGDYTWARAYWEISCSALGQSEDQAALALALHNLGTVLTMENQLVAARRTHERALSLRRRLHNEVGTADSLAGLAEAAYRLGDFQQSRALFEESIAIMERLANQGTYHYQSALRGLCVVARYQGDFKTAHACLREGIAICESMGDNASVAAWHNTLGWVVMDQGAYVEAIDRFKASLVIWRELGNPLMIGLILNNMGEVELRQGHHSVARAYFERSLEAKRHTSDRWSLIYTQINVALLDVATNAWEGARAGATDALAAARELEAKELIARAARVLAIVEIADGRLDDADTLLGESFALTRQMGARREMAATLDVQAGLSTARGDLVAALRHVAEADAVRAAVGTPRDHDAQIEHDRRLAAARLALGAAAVDRLLAEGRDLAGRAAEGRHRFPDIRPWRITL